ncbi:2034_t:CDS:2, partial [Paraglomus occultum]
MKWQSWLLIPILGLIGGLGKADTYAVTAQNQRCFTLSSPPTTRPTAAISCQHISFHRLLQSPNIQRHSLLLASVQSIVDRLCIPNSPATLKNCKYVEHSHIKIENTLAYYVNKRQRSSGYKVILSKRSSERQLYTRSNLKYHMSGRKDRRKRREKRLLTDRSINEDNTFQHRTLSFRARAFDSTERDAIPGSSHLSSASPKMRFLFTKNPSSSLADLINMWASVIIPIAGIILIIIICITVRLCSGERKHATRTTTLNPTVSGPLADNVGVTSVPDTRTVETFASSERLAPPVPQYVYDKYADLLPSRPESIYSAETVSTGRPRKTRGNRVDAVDRRMIDNYSASPNNYQKN